jgi:hypothetical protein
VQAKHLHIHEHTDCDDARQARETKITNLVLDERSQRKVIERIGKVLPHVDIAILSQALIVESVPTITRIRSQNTSDVRLDNERTLE